MQKEHTEIMFNDNNHITNKDQLTAPNYKQRNTTMHIIIHELKKIISKTELHLNKQSREQAHTHIHTRTLTHTHTHTHNYTDHGRPVQRASDLWQHPSTSIEVDKERNRNSSAHVLLDRPTRKKNMQNIILYKDVDRTGHRAKKNNGPTHTKNPVTINEGGSFSPTILKKWHS